MRICDRVEYIYRGFAGYPGSPVATTDPNGHYDTGFTFIPGDEMVTVWAEKAGYTLDPQQYYWRHYYGYEVQTLDFVARPDHHPAGFWGVPADHHSLVRPAGKAERLS